MLCDDWTYHRISCTKLNTSWWVRTPDQLTNYLTYHFNLEPHFSLLHSTQFPLPHSSSNLAKPISAHLDPTLNLFLLYYECNAGKAFNGINNSEVNFWVCINYTLDLSDTSKINWAKFEHLDLKKKMGSAQANPTPTKPQLDAVALP